jgi:co-chaperonin GroES (HSP10)
LSARANLVNFAQYQTPQLLKDAINDRLGSLDGFDVLGDMVLLAVYVEPEKTAGGIIRPNSNVNEAKYQGKCALVLKKGPIAFKYDGNYPYEGPVPNVGDWVFLRVSDAWDIDIKGVPCRMVHSDLIKGIVADPTMIY